VSSADRLISTFRKINRPADTKITPAADDTKAAAA
jgi:hypothetical protein